MFTLKMLSKDSQVAVMIEPMLLSKCVKLVPGFVF
jgi:hypothetical protein